MPEVSNKKGEETHAQDEIVFAMHFCFKYLPGAACLAELPRGGRDGNQHCHPLPSKLAAGANALWEGRVVPTTVYGA